MGDGALMPQNRFDIRISTLHLVGCQRVSFRMKRAPNQPFALSKACELIENRIFLDSQIAN
jgi:hypothetical protein